MTLNRRNPLAQGLVYAKSFASIYTGDSVAKITPTVVDFTQGLASSSPWGSMGYMTTTDLTSDFMDTKFHHDGRGEPNTIAVIWRTTDTEGTLISQRGDDTSNQIISQLFINNSPDQLIFRCDSQSDAVLYEGNEMWDGNWHIASVDWQTGVNCRCFFDGVERNTVTRLTGSDSNNVPALSVGHRWSTYPTVAGYPLGGDFAFAALWNRRITAAEHVALAQNPWQVFAPQRFYVPMTPPAIVEITEEGTTVIISDVNTNETWQDGATGLIVTGTGFV